MAEFTYQGKSGVIRLALLLSFPSFVVQLDGAMLLPAMPAIAEGLSVQPVEIGHSITIFFMLQAIGILASGWIMDRIGAKFACLSALTVYICASVVVAFVDSFSMFIVVRGFQGAVAAIIVVSTRTTLLRITPREDLVQVLSISTIPVLIAPTVGPAFGGLIATFACWRWIFLTTVPLGVIALIALHLTLPVLPAREARRFDVTGFALSALTVLALLGGIQLVSSTDMKALALSVIGVGLISSLLAYIHLRRSSKPILSLEPFSIEQFRIGTIGAGAAIRVAYRGLPFILAILFQSSLDMTPLMTGFLILAIDAGDLLVKPAIASIYRTFGYRLPLVVSSACATLCIALFGFIDAESTKFLIVSLLIVIGVMRSVLFSGIASYTFMNVGEKSLGDATAAFQVAIQVGNSMALAAVTFAIQLRPLISGSYPAAANLLDFKNALFFMSVWALIATIGFWRLPVSDRWNTSS